MNHKTNFPPLTDLIRRVLLSWITAVTLEYLLLPPALRDLSGLTGLGQMSLLRVGVLTAALTAALCLLGTKRSTATAERWAMVAVFSVLTILAVMASPAPAFGIACLLVLGILLVYALRDRQKESPRRACVPPSHGLHGWFLAGMAAAFFLLLSAWGVGRVLSFSTPTYDFGLFAQMFHSMKTTGLPMTTLERDGLLSHFAVHVSPIYYLLLPLYWLFPTPETLQVGQAAVMASAVIPLWKLSKHHGLTGWQGVLICAVMLALPAYAGGASFDIHENCFLTPLLLWLLYGLDRGSTPITAVSALLTLMVKEDAAVYVAIVGLFRILQALAHKSIRKQLYTGLILMGVSVVWFFLVTGYLAAQGDGVMTYRYDNFMYDGSSSLITVIKAVLLNPLKAVYECVNPEKLGYIGLTLGPLLGLPLLTRRYERYALLIPYLLVNLMSDYPYQHDIFFQYNFGSTACLVYLTVVNLADLKLPWQRLTSLGCALLVSFCCFSVAILPTAIRYPSRVMQDTAHYQAIRSTLNTIPGDASVTAFTFYTTYLSQRDIIYDVDYSSPRHMLETDYVVLDVRPYYQYKQYGGLDTVRSILENNDYTIFTELPGVLVIYRAPDA